jgi:hypothetical protein
LWAGDFEYPLDSEPPAALDCTAEAAADFKERNCDIATFLIWSGDRPFPAESDATAAFSTDVGKSRRLRRTMLVVRNLTG